MTPEDEEGCQFEAVQFLDALRLKSVQPKCTVPDDCALTSSSRCIM